MNEVFRKDTQDAILQEDIKQTGIKGKQGSERKKIESKNSKFREEMKRLSGEIRDEIGMRVNRGSERVNHLQDGLKRLGVRLLGMVVSFWLFLIAAGIGLGIPIFIAKEVLTQGVSKSKDEFSKHEDPTGWQGSPSVQAVGTRRENYYVPEARYETRSSFDRNVREANQTVTEVRRMMNSLVVLRHS